MTIVRDSSGNVVKAGLGPGQYNASSSRLANTGMTPGGAAASHGVVRTQYPNDSSDPQSTGTSNTNYKNGHGYGDYGQEGGEYGSYKRQFKARLSDKNQPGSNASVKDDDDWRVKIRMADNGMFYKDPTNIIMAPLNQTDGVIFPYTPAIQMTHAAEYSTEAPTHSNYPIHSYKNSAVATISITGDFTAQNSAEADYVMAMIIFFRSASKMFWGRDSNAGQPPPILYLDGFGEHYLPHVPVVLKSFVNNYPIDVDYVTTRDGKDKVPANTSVTIALEPIYSRSKVHSQFTLDAFSKGNLVKGNGGFI